MIHILWNSVYLLEKEYKLFELSNPKPTKKIGFAFLLDGSMTMDEAISLLL